MKRIIIQLFLAFVFITFATDRLFSQTLQIDKSFIDKDDQCFIGETNACVKVVADQSLKLGFQTNLDGIAVPVSQDTIGGEIRYLLVFDIAKDPFGDRILEISESQSLISCKIDLGDLIKKQTHFCHVSLSKCFTPLFSKGLELFSAGLYQQAKEKFTEARNCYDYSPGQAGQLEGRLAVMDSITSWIANGDESYILLDYDKALKYYDKVYALNPEDKRTEEKRNITLGKKEEYCRKYFNQATKYFKEYEYEKAEFLYRKIIASDCSLKDFAARRLDSMNTVVKRKRERVFTYEFATNTDGFNLPIGFSAGSYRDKRWGGYFSLAMNTDFINMIRSDYPSAVKPNAGISFGWTVRPEKKYVPVWIHFGTGYNFSGAYHYTIENEEKIHYQGGDVPDEKLKLSTYHAVPLEAGILLKIKRFAIRYTYQYRLPLSKKYDSYIEPSVHSIGIGFGIGSGY